MGQQVGLLRGDSEGSKKRLSEPRIHPDFSDATDFVDGAYQPEDEFESTKKGCP
jgi:hypothetical protein